MRRPLKKGMKIAQSTKAIILIIFVILTLVFLNVRTEACILFYAGGDLTEDGANLFMRCEEIGADDNKIYYVSPAGNHLKGETWQGCTDFAWTFTHDSYQYTARCDGMAEGVCLNCGGTHAHTPYEEAGTNDHGVTVSATQSLDPNLSIFMTDPFTENGIEESEMATILPSEASSAREGVEIFAGIYDSVGAAGEGYGIMICDQKEQWYMENLSGHEYIAVLLPADVAFMQFNVSVLGRIDLDDTEHVIASDHLFGVAKKAGTFVGDEEENIIDFRASYNDYLVETQEEDWKLLVQERLAAGLAFLTGEERKIDHILEDNDFIMTNVDENGEICPLHNCLVLKDKVSLETAFELFGQFPIGYEDNINTHLYRFYPEEEQSLGTVEWFSMDNCMYGVYVPSFPMLLTDTWHGYKVQLEPEIISSEKPEEGDWYYHDGIYHVHPKGWDQSYIGTMSALSNLLIYGGLDEDDISQAKYNLQVLQEKFEEWFENLSEIIRLESSVEKRQEIMTEADMEMASQAHALALALYRYYTYGEDSNLIIR